MDGKKPLELVEIPLAGIDTPTRINLAAITARVEWKRVILRQGEHELLKELGLDKDSEWTSAGTIIAGPGEGVDGYGGARVINDIATAVQRAAPNDITIVRDATRTANVNDKPTYDPNIEYADIAVDEEKIIHGLQVKYTGETPLTIRARRVIDDKGNALSYQLIVISETVKSFV